MKTFEKLLVPIWDTDVVYWESMTMLEENGETFAPLLFKPEKVISVQSASQEEDYEEGRDWILKDDKIYLTQNSAIFKFTHEELYPKNGEAGKSFPKENGGYVLFSEGHFFHDRQIAVTYTCKKRQWNGYVPKYEGDNLPRTIDKLINEKTLNLVLFGDSISEGANASGKTICSPFMPSWGDLAAENLRRHYGAKVVFKNPSVGGKATNWAIENADSLVNPHNPDLVILAFGMNDRIAPDEFGARMQKIMNIIREKNPQTEFILVATSLPNPLLTREECKFYHLQHTYKNAIETLCKKGIVMANIRDVQAELLKKKRFIDLTGNNVNHPNDFFIRCHAQTISKMLIS